MSKAAKSPQIQFQLLFDIEQSARILNLTVDTVDCLCRMGELTPSITVGNCRLFSEKDLRQFADCSRPRKISLTGDASTRAAPTLEAS